LGLSYLAAVLEHHRIDVEIFDAHFNRWSSEQLISLIMDYKPTVLGATAMTNEIGATADIVRTIKENIGCKTIVGGPHITALPERTLREFPVFDYGICGEGEKTFLTLMKLLVEEEEEHLSEIEGVVFRNKSGKIHYTGQASRLTSEELDNLPYPAFHRYYGDNSQGVKGKLEEYPIITTRGCPYNCAFCMHVLGKKLRYRSPENIVQEIKFAISQYGVYTINFQDEIFLSDTPKTRQILQMLITTGLNQRIRWIGLTRANLVTEDLIALAREAGCRGLEMGVESGNDEILKHTKKGITVEQIKRAVKIIKHHKIPLGTYYILGHPGETRETIEDTIRLSTELNTHRIAVGLMVPYPGTYVYELARSGQMGYILLTEDWSQYDKYGTKSLELEGLPHSELVRFQKKMYLDLYLKNYRLYELLRLIWARRSAVFYFFKRWISERATSVTEGFRSFTK
jgi:radical SAM superfamily enzyme YgiQ (UPF0313 family)